MKDKDQYRMGIALNEKERRDIKMLAAKEDKSLKRLVMHALDAAFPGWRGERVVGK